tara:strand:- start:1375 stop:1593 length:219 start_codon:yes stop_codon:yes gene_type:complete
MNAKSLDFEMNYKNNTIVYTGENKETYTVDIGHDEEGNMYYEFDNNIYDLKENMEYAVLGLYYTQLAQFYNF